ncbi:thioesterase family protein [Prauserella muralis]|uniref:4-hydroxybenzoyl-CoA thioesterase n=1 Tax=Prauserella muralis TaxID=588067 RepID=A0A2V4AGQ9_9PSEU|nr:thioesterase family protein [Prauserella muralis]PXY19112.1 4-hydroxybenzoyl-CoA thioesterase [Prauserella muralis]TWE29016.1 acyl-CoA thioester hydrolase [Prauserella muralis]
MSEPLEYHDTVRDEWIDYNGHLSEPFYVMVFGFATTHLMEVTGLGERYRAETGCSLYTVEAHVRYLREVGPRADLHVSTSVLSVGARKVRLCHEMRVGGDLVATEELLCVHVGDARAAPFPESVARALRRHLAPAPDYAGRAISS